MPYLTHILDCLSALEIRKGKYCYLQSMYCFFWSVSLKLRIKAKHFAKSCIIAIINSIAPNEYNFCYIVIFSYIKKAFIYLANKMISSKMIVYLSFYLLTQNLRLIESIEDAPATKGVVVLDSLTFNKTISAFRYSFVSFTISSFTQSLHQLTEEQQKKVTKKISFS